MEQRKSGGGKDLIGGGARNKWRRWQLEDTCGSGKQRGVVAHGENKWQE